IERSLQSALTSPLDMCISSRGVQSAVASFAFPLHTSPPKTEKDDVSRTTFTAVVVWRAGLAHGRLCTCVGVVCSELCTTLRRHWGCRSVGLMRSQTFLVGAVLCLCECSSP